MKQVRRVWRWARAKAPPRLVPLDAWATGRHVVVRARVLAGPGEDELVAAERRSARESRGRRLAQRSSLLFRRFAARELSGVEVEARCGSVSGRERSDRRGFVVLRLPVAELPVPRAELRIVSQASSSAVSVYSPSPAAQHLIVSDVDDTILDTELTHPLRRFAQLLLSDRPVRVPFDGVGELYRALTHAGNPLFYVSNSPVQLHHHLRTIFRIHELPEGPLLLRRRGLTAVGEGDFEAGSKHKDQALEQLAQDYPALPILLVGDTSRRDADHYLRLAERWPGRVAAIYIRRVEGRLSFGVDEAALQHRAAAAGVELHVVDSALDVALHAAARGWLADGAVEAVRRASRKDSLQPEPVEELLTG